MILVGDFHSVMPQQLISQDQLLLISAQRHALADKNRSEELMLRHFHRYGVKPQQISQRGVESVELASTATTILERNQFFNKRAQEVFNEFYPDTVRAPSHIIHVTCTGYVAPSPAQALVVSHSWAGKTNVTHAYHMGCYAALPALRMALGFVANGESNVDIAHTEMCTLHFNPHHGEPEQLVVQSLFADGHIRYTVSPQVKNGFSIIAIHESIIPHSQQDMTWQPASWGMSMTLSREVPPKIAQELRGFLTELADKAQVTLAELISEAHFAIHPGGPKIIEAVAEQLELRLDQIAASRKILFDRGNMSSATLPHIWQELLDQQLLSGQKVVSLAFGPGLTIFGSVFTKV